MCQPKIAHQPNFKQLFVPAVTHSVLTANLVSHLRRCSHRALGPDFSDLTPPSRRVLQDQDKNEGHLIQCQPMAVIFIGAADQEGLLAIFQNHR